MSVCVSINVYYYIAKWLIDNQRERGSWCILFLIWVYTVCLDYLMCPLIQMIRVYTACIEYKCVDKAIRSESTLFVKIVEYAVKTLRLYCLHII